MTPTKVVRTQGVAYINGNRVILTPSSCHPGTSLLSFIRNTLSLKGTKCGCDEGGCGACTVIIGKWDSAKNKAVYHTIDSCLFPAMAIDGCHVITVEGLKESDVQKAFVELHASQCGYCTPGFVMSCTQAHHDASNGVISGSVDDIEEYVEGNLCRCTGYRPIIEAGVKVCGRKASNILPSFPTELEAPTSPQPLVISSDNNCYWVAPRTLETLCGMMASFPNAKIVSGGTEVMIEKRIKPDAFKQYVMVSPSHVEELHGVVVNDDGITFGGCLPLNTLKAVLTEVVKSRPKPQTSYARALLDAFEYFAAMQVRNVAGVAGNIVTSSPTSDCLPVLCAAQAKITIASYEPSKVHLDVDAKNVLEHYVSSPVVVKRRTVVMDSSWFTGYRAVAIESHEIIENITLPWSAPGQIVKFYKQSRRRADDIAITSAAMFVAVNESKQITDSRIFYGASGIHTKEAVMTEKLLIGRQLDPLAMMDDQQVMNALLDDIKIVAKVPGGMPEYRRCMVLSLFIKFCIDAADEVYGPESPLCTVSQQMNESLNEARKHYTRFQNDVEAVADATDPSLPKVPPPIGEALPHVAAVKHVNGSALFTDDMSSGHEVLHAYPVYSLMAHAKILDVDVNGAMKNIPGLVRVLTAKDIPGLNIWSGSDEQMICSEYVPAVGCPVAVVVCNSHEEAVSASRIFYKNYVKMERLPDPILTIEDAIAHNSFYPMTWRVHDGNPEEVMDKCDHVISGQTRVGGQEQFYLETQTAMCIPREDNMVVYSATQGVQYAQEVISAILGTDMAKVQVIVERLGGGFGGKETRSSGVAGLCSIAANAIKRPVKITLDRDHDMMATGGRHPFLFQYRVGFSKEGRVQAVDVKMYNNAGHSLDLSAAILLRALFNIDSVYKIDNISAVGRVCRTNVPSNTAYRGFGGPQGVFCMEHMIARIATYLNKPAYVIRELNMYHDGDRTPYGQPLVAFNLPRVWSELKQTSNVLERSRDVDAFNSTHRLRKRGIAMTPLKFGVSFTFHAMNQAMAYVMCYLDGSVVVHHGGVEMGQGLHTKMAMVAAGALGIDIKHVRVMGTDTHVIPNSSATAASVSNDLYAKAVEQACSLLLTRIKPVRELNPSLGWADILKKCYDERIPLAAQGTYAPEGIGFKIDDYDGLITGVPFKYFTYGAAVSEVELDVLTGNYVILRTDVLMDVGRNLNPAVDKGQVEGGYVQGVGWCTMEEVVIGSDGTYRNTGPGMYKIPGAGDVPRDMRVNFLQNSHNLQTVYGFKGIGEPPFLMGMSAFHALEEAVRACRRESLGCTTYKQYLGDGLPVATGDHEWTLSHPATCEVLRLGCGDVAVRASALSELGKIEAGRFWSLKL